MSGFAGDSWQFGETGRLLSVVPAFPHWQTLLLPMTVTTGWGADGMSKSRMTAGLMLSLAAALFVSGCAQTSRRVTRDTTPRPASNGSIEVSAIPQARSSSDGRHSELAVAVEADSRIQLASAEQPAPGHAVDSKLIPTEPEDVDRPSASPLMLDEVLNSVVASYPLLRSAMFGRNIAQGELQQANGEFDLKLKADTLNMPLGFYENYRHAIGAEQPLFRGGSVFGGYRIGRGNYPEWYGDRETNQSGEFKAGATIPLAQNRRIDDRRAGIWRGNLEVQAVEPEIQAQLIAFIQAASITYWNWVAAGQNVRVADDLLKNATERNDGLRKRVEQGDAPPIELTDNERLIVSRRIKLIDAQRKFQQSAFKLSLFLRDESGQPRVIDESRMPPRFPDETDPALRSLDADIQSAVSNRPELRALAILREQLNIDLANAQNLALPQVDAVFVGSQDVGAQAKKKIDDKSPFELESGLIASVPLQRRKALGKAQAVEGKLAQLQAKTQFTQDKIVAEMKSASVALYAAYQQLAQARQALDLARQMEAAERRKFDLGDSNLLLVNLREQATADAAVIEVEAQLNYFDAQADYRAALASDAVP